MQNAYAVILAGGKGERFWPLSTAAHPKQVLSLVGDKPMLAMTVDYVRALIPPERVLIITGSDLVDVTRRAVPELPAENIIGEPVGRDTAAACALAAALVGARNPEAVFCILTADHVIGDWPVFHDTLRDACDLARQRDVLITMGVPPSFPSTGFGYIEAGTSVDAGETTEFRHAVRFVEKPDAATAESYVTSGNYYWNSGMFVWSVDAVRRAYQTHCPELWERIAPLEKAAGTPAFGERLAEAYEGLEKISVDYAIMEKADNIVMACAAFAWDDVGSWPALANHRAADVAGNVVVGDCEALEARDNIVVSRDRLTALIGVRDLVVVQAGDATLICPRDRAQDVKLMVQQLRAAGRHEQVL